MNLIARDFLAWVLRLRAVRGSFKRLMIIRYLSENLFIFLLVYISLMFATLIPHPSPVSFVTGVSCGFIFLRGASILPGIWVGSVFAYYFTQSHFGDACAFGSVYAIQAYLLLQCNYYLKNPTLIFNKYNPLIKFIVSSALITAITSFFLMIICYKQAANPWIFFQWWLANQNGILIVSCALVVWDSYFPQLDTLKQINLFKCGVLLGSVVIFTIALLCINTAISFVITTLIILILQVYMTKAFTWLGGLMGLFCFGGLLSLGANLATPLFFSSYWVTLYLHGALNIMAMGLLWIQASSNRFLFLYSVALKTS